MATITKASKATEADLSGKVMDNSEDAATDSKPEAFELDNEQVRQVISRLRYRLQETVRDANRKRPVLSASQEEARAKAQAFFTVLKETADRAL